MSMLPHPCIPVKVGSLAPELLAKEQCVCCGARHLGNIFDAMLGGDAFSQIGKKRLMGGPPVCPKCEAKIASGELQKPPAGAVFNNALSANPPSLEPPFPTKTSAGVDLSGVPIMLQAMQLCLSDASVQASSCSALADIAGDLEQAVTIIKYGTVPVVLQAMGKHKTVQAVQRNGSIVIGRLVQAERKIHKNWPIRGSLREPTVDSEGNVRNSQKSVS